MDGSWLSKNIRAVNGGWAPIGGKSMIVGNLALAKMRRVPRSIVARGDEGTTTKARNEVFGRQDCLGGFAVARLDQRKGVGVEQFQPADHRALRISFNQKALLITSDGSQVDVVVTDISVGGFRLKAEETFYDGENIVIGETVIVRVKRCDDLKAKIVWAAGCEAGGVFVDPVDLR